MKQMKWFYAAAAALLIAGCGGSDSGSDPVTPPPPPPPPPPVSASGYDVKLIAGQTVYADHEPLDRAVGCVDGPAIGAKINPTAKLYDNMARGPGGELFYADRGLCDGLVRVRAVDAANDTLKTLAVGVSNRADEVAPLTSFNWVTSLAASPDGELYVADSDTFSGAWSKSPAASPAEGRASGASPRMDRYRCWPASACPMPAPAWTAWAPGRPSATLPSCATAPTITCMSTTIRG